METIGGDGSKMGLVTKKKGIHISVTGIVASLTLDYREKSSFTIMLNDSVLLHLWAPVPEDKGAIEVIIIYSSC